MMSQRIDDLQLKSKDGKPLRIIQNTKWFCFGIDAILLSDFARIKKGENVLDMCTGSGVIPILLSAKTNAKHIDAVEIQSDVADLAKQSVSINSLSEMIDVIEADIKSFKGALRYDCITCNPPYKEICAGMTSENMHIAIAKNEVLCNLEEICKCASRNLKFGGKFYLIHRPERLADIISFMRAYDIEPKRIRPVHSYIDKPPVMLLIEGMKSGKRKLIFDVPLIIYKKDGSYTDEIQRIYGKK